MLQSGQMAPLFVLPDADMVDFDLSVLRGCRHVVLFFYPKDSTPQCTLEATGFSDHEDEFMQHDCAVVGLSADDCLRHAEFRDREGISVRLLADEELAVSKAYGVWQEREVDGIHKVGIVRSTFIIDKQGVIRHALYGVNVKGHVQEILRLVKELK